VDIVGCVSTTFVSIFVLPQQTQITRIQTCHTTLTNPTTRERHQRSTPLSGRCKPLRAVGMGVLMPSTITVTGSTRVKNNEEHHSSSISNCRHEELLVYKREYRGWGRQRDGDEEAKLEGHGKFFFLFSFFSLSR
jgi:hypothetical protein